MNNALLVVGKRAVIFVLLLFTAAIPAFAQDGDPYSGDQVMQDEEDLYIDEFNRKRRSDGLSQTEPSGGFYMGNLIGSKPPQELNGPPTTPTDPDILPIDGAIAYLMVAGLGYGGHKLRKNRKKRMKKQDE